MRRWILVCVFPRITRLIGQWEGNQLLSLAYIYGLSVERHILIYANEKVASFYHWHILRWLAMSSLTYMLWLTYMVWFTYMLSLTYTLSLAYCKVAGGWPLYYWHLLARRAAARHACRHNTETELCFCYDHTHTHTHTHTLTHTHIYTHSNTRTLSLSPSSFSVTTSLLSLSDILRKVGGRIFRLHHEDPQLAEGYNTVYGMALVSRIDKIIGLFCKRTL